MAEQSARGNVTPLNLHMEKPGQPYKRLNLPPWLIVLMVLPWLWTSLGLYVFKDYRLAVGLYEFLGCLVPVVFFMVTRPAWALRPCRSLWLWGLILLSNAVLLIGFSLFQEYIIAWDVFLPRVLEIGLEPQREFWLFATYFVAFNPVIEELFWRGLIYEQLKQRMALPAALLISSFFFGLWHWVIVQHYFTTGWAILATLLVMVGGVLFAGLYEKTGSLMPPILVHGLGADLPIVLIFYEALVRTQGL